MVDTSTKAWKVTAENTGVLHNISNCKEEIFTANIGWVLVEDWSERPRFLLLPENVFHDYYPRVEFTELEIDRDTKPLYNKFQLEQLIEKAGLLGFTDDVKHWKSELEKLNGNNVPAI